MQGMGGGGDDCPFAFNFDAATFKVGDTVSYRITGNPMFEDMPFVGQLLEVHDDFVVIAGDANDPSVRYRGTRESRPQVAASEI
ncbi:hypothetical protein Saro_0896 [Novosphingobium aromaticivorans DSM 12444]|uniref:Uncharacterized protein n=1 Tax=Novosphingobium aromaticivorans (strain ATCC 700278 / DSM 12444 / CCUG 56034 / CIP 105152 / NBRC 16084 / F199) TaxID=279238 RepID=Q2G9Y2_NOVAD|nr:hypothetical protein [Novosphingobium aromaticivorans]ABD25341.1 hypothetical protein Saro_0896 [Novosphingobium aromaticivorans DSM 12444]SCX90498.1 hypothetical protein SAMN05660666_00226 [Novosphingobium aromaticivorans]